MNSLQFLIEVPFTLYLMLVLLRLWLQWARADFYNPFSQMVVKATNPLLRPLRRVIPGWGGFDFASLILALIVAALKIVTLKLVLGGGFPPAEIAIAAAMTVLQESFSLIFWIMLLRVILSWVSQGHNPIEMVVHQLTEPMLGPIRRVIPPMGGLDLSVLVFLIALQFFQLLLGDVLRAFS